MMIVDLVMHCAAVYVADACVQGRNEPASLHVLLCLLPLLAKLLGLMVFAAGARSCCVTCCRVHAGRERRYLAACARTRFSMRRLNWHAQSRRSLPWRLLRAAAAFPICPYGMYCLLIPLDAELST